jgi:hypothetical protein
MIQDNGLTDDYESIDEALKNDEQFIDETGKVVYMEDILDPVELYEHTMNMQRMSFSGSRRKFKIGNPLNFD